MGALLFLAHVPGLRAESAPQQPSLTNLGDGQLKMGEILIDKPGRSFSVAGKILRDSPPLEYLAVKKDGRKAYESVMELDTTASEFNIACILIGLQTDHAVLPRYHFDPQPVQGDPVEIAVAWRDGEQTKTLAAEEIFQVGGKPVTAREWVYTGSTVLRDNRYLAEETGTLIGFIHDSDSIIEHRQGIGLGAIGTIMVDKDRFPPVGTEIRLTVRNATPPGKPDD